MSRKEYAGGSSARYLLLELRGVPDGLRTRHDLLGVLDLGLRQGRFGAALLHQAADLRAHRRRRGRDLRRAVRLPPSHRDHWGSRRGGCASGLLAFTYMYGVVRGGARALDPTWASSGSCSRLSSPRSPASWLPRHWPSNGSAGASKPTSTSRSSASSSAIPAVLIVFQPDLGTTILMVVGVGIVLFLGGIEVNGSVMAVCWSSSSASSWSRSEPYRLARVASASLNPWSDATAVPGVEGCWPSATAVSRGCNRAGCARFFYLPEPAPTSSSRSSARRRGSSGTVAVVLAFGVLRYAGTRIAMGAPASFGKLVAGALTGMLAFQAVLNMAAVARCLSGYRCRRAVHQLRRLIYAGDVDLHWFDPVSL